MKFPISQIRWPVTIGLTLVLMVVVTTMTASADVEIMEHTEGGLIGGLWELSITVLGNVSGAQMRVDGGSPIGLKALGPGSYGTLVNTTAYQDGSHKITITAQGADNTTDEVMVGVDVDNTAPEIEVEWPNATVKYHPFELSASYDDAHPDGVVAWVELLDGDVGTIPLERTDGILAGAINIVDLEEGENRMRVIVADGVGNEAASEVHLVEVRKLPDLYLETMNFRSSSPQVVQGTYIIYYKVRNVGYAGTGTFEVALEVDGEIEVKSTTYESLNANGTFEGQFRWSPSEARAYNLSIVVDPDDLIEELSETNNAGTDRQSFSDNGACMASAILVFMPAGVLVGNYLGVRRRSHP